MLNLGKQSGTLAFRSGLGELDNAIADMAGMLNGSGHGSVLFGVSAEGDVLGLDGPVSDPDAVGARFKGALSPSVSLVIQTVTMDGRPVLRVEASGNEKPYSASGRYYNRVLDRTVEMTPDELQRMILAGVRDSMWENSLTESGMDAVDSEALERFYSKAVGCGRLEPMDVYDPAILLQDLGLMVGDRLTAAGFLLFSSRKPVVINAAVHVTDERIASLDSRCLEGNVYGLLDSACLYIQEHMNWRADIVSGAARAEIPEIPVPAIREVVVNAFAHADYHGASCIAISITPTRIDICNPGAFPEGFTAAMFVEGKVSSIPRNPVISRILCMSKDAEMQGSGLRKAISLCRESGTRVEYSPDDGGFRFTFFRQGNPKVPAASGGKSKGGLSASGTYVSNEDRLVDMLKENPSYTRAYMGEVTDRSVRTIQRSLDKLEAEGRIRRVGSRKTGHWEVLQ